MPAWARARDADTGTPLRSLFLLEGVLYFQAAGFECLLTGDTNIRYQQNLTSRRIALVVLS